MIRRKWKKVEINLLGENLNSDKIKGIEKIEKRISI